MSDYPSEADLRRLRKWDHTDPKGALEFAQSLWAYPDYVWKRGRRYTFATGGWSGNEAVIAALEKNLVVQALCWLASYRGGKHVYEVPKTKSPVTKRV